MSFTSCPKATSAGAEAPAGVAKVTAASRTRCSRRASWAAAVTSVLGAPFWSSWASRASATSTCDTLSCRNWVSWSGRRNKASCCASTTPTVLSRVWAEAARLLSTGASVCRSRRKP